MPATQGLSVKGVIFKRAGVAIAEVNAISGPNITRTAVKATQLDSPEGYNEYIPGFKDGGEITLNMNFTRNGWVDFMADMDNTAKVAYSVVFPDDGATEIQVDALATGLGIAIPEDGKVNMDVTLKVSGAVELVS